MGILIDAIKIAFYMCAGLTLLACLMLYYAIKLPILLIIWLVHGRKKPFADGGIYTPNVKLDIMNGHDFEYMCADLLRSGNFRRVEVTPGSNDYGADIIAEDQFGNRWAIQCKRYLKNCTNSPVQEVVGSKAHYRANKAAVITTAGYTKGAKRLAKDNEVVLIDRKGLEKMMRGREITLENLVLYDIITED